MPERMKPSGYLQDWNAMKTSGFHIGTGSDVNYD